MEEENRAMCATIIYDKIEDFLQKDQRHFIRIFDYNTSNYIPKKDSYDTGFFKNEINLSGGVEKWFLNFLVTNDLKQIRVHYCKGIGKSFVDKLLPNSLDTSKKLQELKKAN